MHAQNMSNNACDKIKIRFSKYILLSVYKSLKGFKKNITKLILYLSTNSSKLKQFWIHVKHNMYQTKSSVVAYQICHCMQCNPKSNIGPKKFSIHFQSNPFNVYFIPFIWLSQIHNWPQTYETKVASCCYHCCIFNQIGSMSMVTLSPKRNLKILNLMSHFKYPTLK